MCIRKLMFCPTCRAYSKIPNVTIPLPNGSINMLIYEYPCGLGYCECFNQLNAYIERPFNPDECDRPCSPSCDITKCKIDVIIRSCCMPTTENIEYRLISLQMYKQV